MSGRTKSFDEFASKLNFYKSDRPRSSNSLGSASSSSEAAATASSEDTASNSSRWFSQFVPDGKVLAKLGKAVPGSATVVNSTPVLGLAAGMTAAAQKGLQGAAAVTGRTKTIARSASTQISEVAISRRTWMSFFGCVCLGSALMSLAFCFLPMIVLAPQKFALLFTLGSMFFLCSFSILKGHKAFMRHLLSRGRILFTTTYASSMVGTLWASLVYRSYVLALLFSVVQVCALAWFLFSYIPGGRRALSVFTGIAWRFSKVFCRCASRGSLLPF